MKGNFFLPMARIVPSHFLYSGNHPGISSGRKNEQTESKSQGKENDYLLCHLLPIGMNGSVLCRKINIKKWQMNMNFPIKAERNLIRSIMANLTSF